MWRKRRWLPNGIILALIMLFLTVPYLWDLQHTPIHVNQDELGFALNARAISRTGYDTNGRLLPLYLWHLDTMWAPAMNVYYMALWLRVVPFEIGWMRLASVSVGLAGVGLTYGLMRQAGESKRIAAIAAIFLAMAPAYFMHSRIVLEHIYALFFQLGWIYFLLKFRRTKVLSELLLACLMLGVGFHSYHATKILMPLAWLFTLALLYPLWFKQKQGKILVAGVLGFWIPMIPLLTWLPRYPDTFVDQVRYNQLYDAQGGTVAGVLSMLNWESLYSRVSVYLSYFNPSFLLTRGDISLAHSTREAGAILLPFILLLPFGVKYAWENRKSDLVKIVVFCLITAPIPTSIANQGERISRVLPLVAALAILAAWGWKKLMTLRWKQRYAYMSVFVVALTVFYVGFLWDYFGDYRLRSADWFNGDMEGMVAQTAHARGQTLTGGVYVDTEVRFAKQYFEFYGEKYQLNRESIMDLSMYDLRGYNPGDLIVISQQRYNELGINRLIQLHQITTQEDNVIYILNII